jgi:hypothetical protein
MSGRRFVLLACLLLSLPAAPGARAVASERAYEQVSPPDKNGGDVGGPAFRGSYRSGFAQASSDGDSITYVSLQGFADTENGEMVTQYMSTRRAGGWSTQAISPPGSAARGVLSEDSPFRLFADDLSVALLEWAVPALDAGAPPGFESPYLRRADGSYRALSTVTPPNQIVEIFGVTVAGASAGFDSVVFEANDALTSGAPPNARSVYEWTGSALRLVSVLPDGTAAASAGAGAGARDDFSEVVSSDGSRVFWTDADSQLYVRVDGVQTLKLNASQRAFPAGDGAATLRAISANGSKAVFTDATPLTDAAGDNGGLYEAGLDDGRLLPLTPTAGGPPGVQGVLGASEDGSVVYFVASATLAPGATEGAMNLYMTRGGTTELIAVLAAGDGDDWTTNLERRSARVTPDGLHLAFLSRGALTGYDSSDPVSGEHHAELFLYEVAEDRLTCVSCNPSGDPPIGDASLPPGVNLSYQPRVLSDDGELIAFNSPDALVSGDGNARQDVYEYSPGGVRLVSAGTSPDASALADISPDGRDVFFTTRSALAAGDRDNDSDMYDARLGGGFAMSRENLPCEGEACRGPLAAPPAFPLPATSRQAAGHGERAGRRRVRCRVRPRGARRGGRPRCGRVRRRS